MTSISTSPLAYSPASLTAFFQPVFGETPATTVSRGLALCVNQGVTAGIRGSQSHEVYLNGTLVNMPAVSQVVEQLAPEPIAAILETSLPVGCGFGVSAASALSAAFAINHRFRMGKTRHELGMVAHVAEVSSRTGIGDVAAQLTGGIVFRHCTSGPLDATRLENIPEAHLYCRYFAPLSTRVVLSNPELMATVLTAGRHAVEWLQTHQHSKLTLAMLLDRSLQFAKEAGLLNYPAVNDAIAMVHSAGGHATMMMLGQSVLASLSHSPGDHWAQFNIDSQGTRLL